ncbi:MAG: amidohydrolase family protein [Betaproteobacteria bacterium]
MLLVQNARVMRPDLDCAPADILVERDTIVELVSPGEVKDDNVRRIDAAGKLIVPGLVNGHNHAQANLAKGVFDRYTLETYLNALPWAIGRRTAEDQYLSAVIGAAEMARKGCTASYDMFAEFPQPTAEGVAAVAKGYADVGIRAAIAPMMADRSFYQAIPGLADALPGPLREAALRIRYADHRSSLAACRSMMRDWPYERDFIRPALGPTIPHHCSDEFLAGCRDLAEELDVGIQMHVAESKVQALVGQRKYGMSFVAHLDSLRMLGPRFCASHAIWLDDDDRARLADRGASVSHNPGSNMKVGSGMADARRMIDRGVNLAIGTDGVVASDNLNLFEAMRLAAFVSRVAGHPPERWLSAREVLRAATEAGARALGFGGKIGRIERGYKADLVFLDLGSVNYTPLNDAVNQLVFCEDGTGVHSVMVGGRMILEAGRFTTIDFPRIAERAATAVERLREANRPTRELAEKLEPYVAQYCSGLAATCQWPPR